MTDAQVFAAWTLGGFCLLGLIDLALQCCPKVLDWLIRQVTR